MHNPRLALVLSVLAFAAVLVLPIMAAPPVGPTMPQGLQASLFQEWISTNMAGMQQPDATFATVERDLTGPVSSGTIHTARQEFRSTNCSTGCSMGCSTGCSMGCSMGCSSGCSSGCSYGCR
jgi:hypothetical protein